jgi:hypothetical protein
MNLGVNSLTHIIRKERKEIQKKSFFSPLERKERRTRGVF